MMKPEAHDGDDRVLAAQQRRHLVALYLSARNHAARLEGLLTTGRSPSGYGPPLVPPTPEQAEAVMEPVRELLARLREFLRRHAGGELAELERAQDPRNTLVWASQLVSNLHDVAAELTPRRLVRYGAPAPDDANVDVLRAELMDAVGRGRSAIAEARREQAQPE